MFSTYFDMPLNEILHPKQKFKYLQNFCPALIGRSSDEIRAALRSIVHQAGLVEIDISEACTEAFVRIKAIPVFNEFDSWHPYAAD